MKIRRIMPGLLVIANLAALAVVGQAQSLLDSGKSYRPCCQHHPGATGPHVQTSDGGNEDPQLPLRRIRPVSHRRRRVRGGF